MELVLYLMSKVGIAREVDVPARLAAAGAGRATPQQPAAEGGAALCCARSEPQPRPQPRPRSRRRAEAEPKQSHRKVAAARIAAEQKSRSRSLLCKTA